MEHVAGQTCRMDAREHRVAVLQRAEYERDVRFSVSLVLVDVDLEIPVIGGQLGGRDRAYDRLRTETTKRCL